MCVVCRVREYQHQLAHQDHHEKNLHTHAAKHNGDWEWDIHHLMSGAFMTQWVGHLWFNGLGIYDLMGGAFMVNSVKVEKKKKLNISGYSALKLPVRVLATKYFVSTWFSNISLYICML